MDVTGIKGKPLAGLALMLVAPLVIGCVLAPWIYNWLSGLAASGALPASLAEDLKFERVTSRCVQVSALLLLIPAFRLAGLGPRLRDALRPSPDRWTALGRALAIGCVSMFAIYVGGWMIGAYRVTDGAAAKAAGAVFFVLGAALVGLCEEAFFRGFVFGAIRSRSAFWTAAVLSSVFFSAIHFFRPDAPLANVPITWSSGFELMPYLFSKFKWSSDWAYMITLVLMGLTLCLYYERQGHLFTAIGLHAGWVWAMRLGGEVFDRNRDVMQALFSRSDLIA
ncbi:MAG TPA: CPBP family intramembrane glutamic endopeptidase, partial [Kiritimatiellia bacterium]